MNKKEGRILVVDDNEELLTALSLYLSPYFSEIKTISNPNQIPELIGKDDYDIILLDMNYSPGQTSGNEGIYWMGRILEIDPTASVVFITAFGDVKLAVKAIKEGAADFIEKSWDEKKILSTVLSAYQIRKSRKEIQQLRSKQNHLTEQLHEGKRIMVGESEEMKRIIDTIEKVAGTGVNILILGENGTGKEVIAREIHRLSRRSDEIFVSVDLGSLTENLFESELFGYEKGAFTDARESRPGRFEIATGGTLYLDEIGNLPLSLQSKLLSAIQNREISRLGSHRKIPVDIRLICATNMPLYDMAEKGSFREDLLYRINTIQVDLPPLRDRRDDIPVLAGYFLEKYRRKYGKSITSITRTGLDKLIKHSWYGNIRELEHIIEKAVILSGGKVLEAADFQFFSRQGRLDNPPSLNLLENEKRLIIKVLQKFRGNISQSARELGINRSTLYEKIKKYGL
jgi:DNA-binding NtrC family response regulator